MPGEECALGNPPIKTTLYKNTERNRTYYIDGTLLPACINRKKNHSTIDSADEILIR